MIFNSESANKEIRRLKRENRKLEKVLNSCYDFLVQAGCRWSPNIHWSFWVSVKKLLTKSQIARVFKGRI